MSELYLVGQMGCSWKVLCCVVDCMSDTAVCFRVIVEKAEVGGVFVVAGTPLHRSAVPELIAEACGEAELYLQEGLVRDE